MIPAAEMLNLLVWEGSNPSMTNQERQRDGKIERERERERENKKGEGRD